MAKTKEELEQLKKEFEELIEKLGDLTEEELEKITGGTYRKEIGSDKNAKIYYE